jgi:hypothetical protein
MRLHRTIALSLTLLTACPGPQSEPTRDSETTAPTQTTGSASEPTSGDACVEADGCYACEPQEPAHLLNHCTTASCQPFANTRDRLPRLMPDGALPPLP